jgi:hypothetical protein
MQKIKTTYLVQRLDDRNWVTVSSGYRSIKSVTTAFKKFLSNHKQSQYRIAEQKEITTISIEKIIRCVENQTTCTQ